MSELPLHPGLVHVPLGLAFVLPFVAAGVVLAMWRAPTPRWPFGTVVALLAFMTIGGWAAQTTGEQEEERVEERVGHDLVHAHEEAAEQFVWAAFATLVLSVGGLSLPERWARRARAGTAVAAFAVAALAFRAGELGGELVYVHGAADSQGDPSLDGDTEPGQHPSQR